VTVEAMVVVEVTAATEAVTVDAVTLQHEQALLYATASEHRSLTYVGSRVEAGAVSVRFFNGVVVVTAEVVATQAGGAVVTVTVTADSYDVTHVVLRIRGQLLASEACWSPGRGNTYSGTGVTVTARKSLQSARRLEVSGSVVAYLTARAQPLRTHPP
jgi:hypothetical protein